MRAVLIPVWSILLTATIIISIGTIEQKNGKIDWIEVWPKESTIQGGHTPEDTCQDFRNIMKVTRNFPITIEKKQRRAFLSLLGGVFCLNSLWDLSKDSTVSIRLAKYVPLVVRVVVYPDHEKSAQEDEEGNFG
jgi:hypothetical protein